MIPSGDEDRLLFIPGPTPVHRDILDALAGPTISHTSAQLASTMSAALRRLKMVAGLHDGRMFVFGGSGTLAQEAAIVNFVGPGDSLLVASNGYFATRLHTIAQQYGLKSSLREARLGTAITADELNLAIEETHATVVAFTHVETSTGVMAPLPELMRIIQNHGALSIIDGVAAFGGVAEPMDELGIDVLLTGAQKALGLPPGLAIIGVGSRAWEKRTSRTDTVPSFYGDLVRWAPVMDQPDKYFSTHPVNLIQALAKAMEIIEAEGIENRYARHSRLANRFRSRLDELECESFADRKYLAPTMSAVCTPGWISASELRRRLYTNGVVAAGGLNDQEDRIVRFGHMGNISDAEIATALDAVERSLKS